MPEQEINPSDKGVCQHGNFKTNPCEACESEAVNEKEVKKTNRALKETVEVFKDIAKNNSIADGFKKVKEFFGK